MDFISIYSFLQPEFVPERDWAAHLPFGFWLMNELQPKVCVETTRANGYLRFLNEQLQGEANLADDLSVAADLVCLHASEIVQIGRVQKGVIVVLGTEDSSDWAMLRNEAPSFEFRHSGGLGVVGSGTSAVGPLFSAGQPEEIRSVYQTIGRSLTLARDEMRKRQELIEKLGMELDHQRKALEHSHRDEAAQLRHELKRATAAAAHYQSEYEKAIHSRSWQITRPLREGNGLREKVKALFDS